MLSFEDLGALVERCTKPAHGFYRRLYRLSPETASVHPQSWVQWRALPLLIKDDLIAAPFSERSYLPPSGIDHVRTSSGTSGKGPLFSPRTPLRGMEYRLDYHDFKKPILAYGVPAMPHWHEQFQRAQGALARVIAFDPAHPAACARLARIAGIDALSLFAFHITLIAPHLVAEGIAENIRFIEISGEACTKKLFEFMRETFPNATIIPFYGSREVEDSPIGMPCRAITGEEPLSLYHSKESQYLELIDPDTGVSIEPEPGVEGELIITAYPGEPSAFPMIRFRTGDIVRVIEKNCARHHSWSFTVLGRSGMDFLKLPGGVLRVDEIERVLRSMPRRVSDRFELHCYESASPRGPLFKPVLHVEARDPDLIQLAADIAHQIRVAPEFTYADGTVQGRYEALSCEILSPSAGSKTKRIVRH